MLTSGTLWVVATPIGNLEDVSLRALRVLREVAVIACEDTRTTRKLLVRHGIEAKLVSCHEHNETERGRELAERLTAGESVALVTDAGTPLVSDPGRAVIAAAIAAGVPVVPIPGPSAAIAALSVSGLPTERFTFFGFAPAKGAAAGRFLDEVIASPVTAILYEAPHRIAKTLTALAALAPDRPASLHRELTKLHEETRRGTLAELAAGFAAGDAPRGEITLIVGGDVSRPDAAAALDEAVARARDLVSEGVPAGDAARTAARETGARRNAVYRRLLDPA